MDQLFVTSACRLCLWKSSRLFNIFSKKYLKDKITMVIPVTVVEGDGLSPFVCDECLYKVELFLRFRETATRADHLQREYNCIDNGFVTGRETTPITTPKSPQTPSKSDCKEPSPKERLSKERDSWPTEVVHEEETSTVEPTSSSALEDEQLTPRRKSISQYRCRHCCKRVSSEEELVQHEQKHTDYECIVCNKKHSNTESLRFHLSKACSVPSPSSDEEADAKEGIFKCGTCFRTFRSHIGLWRHCICISHSVSMPTGRLRPRQQGGQPLLLHRRVPYSGRGSRGGSTRGGRGGRSRGGRGLGRGGRGGIHPKLGTRRWLYVKTPCDVCGHVFNSSTGMLIHRKHMHG